ncbi:MAG: cytidylate kinase-like family protein, partial [Eubacterium sp.]|nr:cytidylate kinase-like family protein [Eubacterium sp.]
YGEPYNTEGEVVSIQGAVCHIVKGSCADVILKDYRPFNIFVYADMDTKLKQCMEHAPKDENLTHTELEHKIRDVNKERAKHREFYIGTKGNTRSNYHLCTNTSGIEIKKGVRVTVLVVRCKSLYQVHPPVHGSAGKRLNLLCHCNRHLFLYRRQIMRFVCIGK